MTAQRAMEEVKRTYEAAHQALQGFRPGTLDHLGTTLKIDHLRKEMLGKQILAEERSEHYQEVERAALIPTSEYWRHTFQQAVESLCVVLTGEVAAANAEGVTLPITASLSELEGHHLVQRIAVRRRKAGLT